MTTTPLGEQAFKCFGISISVIKLVVLLEECSWARELPSQNTLAAAAFLTPRLQNFAICILVEKMGRVQPLPRSPAPSHD